MSARSARPTPVPGGVAAPLTAQADAVAASLGLRPDDLASVITRATLIAAALDWHSGASDAFVARLHAVVAALRTASDQLEQARDLFAQYAAAQAESEGVP